MWFCQTMASKQGSDLTLILEKYEEVKALPSTRPGCCRVEDDPCCWRVGACASTFPWVALFLALLVCGGLPTWVTYTNTALDATHGILTIVSHAIHHPVVFSLEFLRPVISFTVSSVVLLMFFNLVWSALRSLQEACKIPGYMTVCGRPTRRGYIYYLSFQGMLTPLMWMMLGWLTVLLMLTGVWMVLVGGARTMVDKALQERQAVVPAAGPVGVGPSSVAPTPHVMSCPPSCLNLGSLLSLVGEVGNSTMPTCVCDAEALEGLASHSGHAHQALARCVVALAMLWVGVSLTLVAACCSFLAAFRDWQDSHAAEAACRLMAQLSHDKSNKSFIEPLAGLNHWPRGSRVTPTFRSGVTSRPASASSSRPHSSHSLLLERPTHAMKNSDLLQTYNFDSLLTSGSNTGNALQAVYIPPQAMRNRDGQLSRVVGLDLPQPSGGVLSGSIIGRASSPALSCVGTLTPPSASAVVRVTDMGFTRPRDKSPRR